MKRFRTLACASGALIMTPVQAQEAPTPAQAALREAEQAAREATEAAQRAIAAVELANERLAEARRLMGESPVISATTVKSAAILEPKPQSDIVLAEGTPIIEQDGKCSAAIDLTSDEYLRDVEDCEAFYGGGRVPSARRHGTTGVGSAVAVSGDGSAGTIMLERISRDRDTFKNGKGVWQQRVRRFTFGIGARSPLDKENKNSATILTRGQLDKLSADLTGLVKFGFDRYKSEPFAEVQTRAKKLREEQVEKCKKATSSKCEGAELLTWILASTGWKYDNPEAVKAYNDVFWGPQPTDKHPRWGVSFSGEVSKPSFEYFPFVLKADQPDPFRPGKFVTIIDPTANPANFGDLLTTSSRWNFVAAARAFLHFNTNDEKVVGDSWLDLFSGTTVVASVAYKREDKIEKSRKDVTVCPPPSPGQPFQTNLGCTVLNIAAPVQTESFVLGAELRQAFEPFWFVPETMWSPRFTYDVDSKEKGVSLPILFGLDKDGLFTTGVRFAWEWGGRDSTGMKNPSEFLFGVTLNASLSLDGATGSIE